MNNEIDEKKELDDSASIEIKEGFFSKLFSSFGRKALPPANGTVKTNASISSLMARGSLRAALISLGNKIQNVFSPQKDDTPANTLSAHVIGENNKDENSVDKSKVDDETVLYAEQPRVFIPTPKNIAANRRTTVLNNTPNLSVEEINVDSDIVIDDTEIATDETVLVHEDSQAQTISQNLQAIDIVVDNKDPKSKNEKNDIEHTPDR